MGNEDVIDLASPDLVFGHLHLCAFSAIHQEHMFIHCYNLGSRVPVERRQRRIISQDGDSKHVTVLRMKINEALDPVQDHSAASKYKIFFIQPNSR